MLTPEQISNLKPGDPVIIHTRFIRTDKDGDIEFESPFTYNNIKKESDSTICSEFVSLASEHGTFLSRRSSEGAETEVPTPKHDPTRLFKKGDKVRVKNINGRHYNLWSKKMENQIFVVAEDERELTNVYLCVGENRPYGVDPAYLELVTPVEELGPYLMLENVPSNSIEVRDKRTNKVEATFYFGKDHAYTFEQAATRAEAERDRLNAEWRKEQNTNE